MIENDTKMSWKKIRTGSLQKREVTRVLHPIAIKRVIRIREALLMYTANFAASFQQQNKQDIELDRFTIPTMFQAKPV